MDLREEGPLELFAGVEFHWGDGYLELGQASGIERGVLRYFPQAAGLTPTQLPALYDLKTRKPSTDGCNLLESGADRSFLKKYPPYLSFIALALYFAHFTRGDLLMVVVFLCRFMADPNEQCHICGLYLMSCLYHTRRDRIRYTRSGWNIPQQIAQEKYKRKAPMADFEAIHRRCAIGKRLERKKPAPALKASAKAALMSRVKSEEKRGWIEVTQGRLLDLKARVEPVGASGA